MLDGIGLDPDKDFQPITLDKPGDGPAMVLDGRAAALWGGGIGWPGFTAMASARRRALHRADAGEIARILARHEFLKRDVVPGRRLQAIPRHIPSVGSWSFVFARTGLPRETAYRLARALHKAEAAKSPQPADTTAANTLAALSPR